MKLCVCKKSIEGNAKRCSQCKKKLKALKTLRYVEKDEELVGSSPHPSSKMTKAELALRAKETQNILEQIDLTESLSGTVLYSDFEFEWPLNPNYVSIHIVTNYTTIGQLEQFTIPSLNKVSILNFASANNIGGGWLKGSVAQEEDIARASGLVKCLSKKEIGSMYRGNQGTNGFYKNDVVFCSSVPFFRYAEGSLRDIYNVSIISCPAVNATIAKERGETRKKIDEVMESRIERILRIAVINGKTRLVLGAFGCGVFGNDPETVAMIFKRQLEGQFDGYFEQVFFAIPGSKNVNEFRSVFPNVD
jgi:uncharacterized protein (TIGR02452 family)